MAKMCLHVKKCLVELAPVYNQPKFVFVKFKLNFARPSLLTTF